MTSFAVLSTNRKPLDKALGLPLWGGSQEPAVWAVGERGPVAGKAGEFDLPLFLVFGCWLNWALSQTLTHPAVKKITAAVHCQGFFQGLGLEFWVVSLHLSLSLFSRVPKPLPPCLPSNFNAAGLGLSTMIALSYL